MNAIKYNKPIKLHGKDMCFVDHVQQVCQFGNNHRKQLKLLETCVFCIAALCQMKMNPTVAHNTIGGTKDHRMIDISSCMMYPIHPLIIRGTVSRIRLQPATSPITSYRIVNAPEFSQPWEHHLTSRKELGDRQF